MSICSHWPLLRTYRSARSWHKSAICEVQVVEAKVRRMEATQAICLILSKMEENPEFHRDFPRFCDSVRQADLLYVGHPPSNPPMNQPELIVFTRHKPQPYVPEP